MNKKVGSVLLNILLCIAVFSVLYSIMCFWSNSAHGFQSIYRDTDKLQVPFITHNLLYEHGHISNWIFSETPYFFPDIICTYFISLFNQNIIINIIVYALIQILALMLIVSLILKTITHRSITIGFSIAFTLIIFLLSNELIGNSAGEEGIEFFSAMIMSSQHFGSTLVVLLSLYLFIQTCIHRKVYLVVLFFIVTVLGIFSDVLVGFYLTVPLMLTVIYCWWLKLISNKDCKQLVALLFITTLSGYLLYRSTPLHYYPDHQLTHFHFKNIHAFAKLMIHFFKTTPAIAIIWLSFVFLAPVSLIHTYRQEGKLLDPKMRWTNFIILWQLVIVICCIPAFILTDHNIYLALADVPYFGLRHLQPLILCPVLIGLPLLIYKHTNIFALLTNKALFGLVLCLIIIATFINTPPALNRQKLLSYYPPEIACLDEQATKLHLHAGIRNYWQTKTFSSFSHAGIKVASVTDEFTPFLVVTSTEYFKGNNFDFIIVTDPLHKFDKKAVLTRFGKPTSTFICPSHYGNYEFYAYTNNAMNELFTQK